jgi:hypothetical protein
LGNENPPVLAVEIENIAIKIRPENRRQEPVTSIVEQVLTNLVVKI